MRRGMGLVCLIGMLCLIGACERAPSGLPSTPMQNGTRSPTDTASQPRESGVAVGQLAPEFSTTLLDGSIQSLKGLRGQVVLINFWATWCGPCRLEMPFFQTLADQYKDQGFVVLAINNRESADKMQPFVDELKLHFPIALDQSGRINGQYMVRQYPTSYVIGRDGVVLARQFGAFPEGAVEAALMGWLK